MHHSLQLLTLSTTHPPYDCRKIRPKLPCLHRSQLYLYLPSAPFPSPLGSSHLSDEQCPVRQAYNSWKLKYGNMQKSLKQDLDLNAVSVLPTLQNILDNTKNLSPQARAETCRICLARIRL